MVWQAGCLTFVFQLQKTLIKIDLRLHEQRSALFFLTKGKQPPMLIPTIGQNCKDW